MKINMYSNKKISFHSTDDNKNEKELCIGRKTALNFPDGTKTIRFVQKRSEKARNIFAFVFTAIICAFFESQKAFEKREFISFYDFSHECLTCDFSVDVSGGETDNINIFAKENDFGKFKCTFWYSDNSEVSNQFPFDYLKSCLRELIGFWFVVLFIPIIIITALVIIAYIKTKVIFELGTVLIAFLLILFCGNSIMFLCQYKNIVKSVKKTLADING